MELLRQLSDEEIAREQAMWLLAQHARLAQELMLGCSCDLMVESDGGVTGILWRRRLDERSRCLDIPM